MTRRLPEDRNNRYRFQRTDWVNIVRVNGPVGAVVWVSDTSNVGSVFLAGYALERIGRLLNADSDHIGKMVRQSRN